MIERGQASPVRVANPLAGRARPRLKDGSSVQIELIWFP